MRRVSGSSWQRARHGARAGPRCSLGCRNQYTSMEQGAARNVHRIVGELTSGRGRPPLLIGLAAITVGASLAAIWVPLSASSWIPVALAVGVGILGSFLAVVIPAVWSADASRREAAQRVFYAMLGLDVGSLGRAGHRIGHLARLPQAKAVFRTGLATPRLVRRRLRTQTGSSRRQGSPGRWRRRIQRRTLDVCGHDQVWAGPRAQALASWELRSAANPPAGRVGSNRADDCGPGRGYRRGGALPR